MSAQMVYQAINQVMAIMAKEGISKDRKNKEQGFSFRGIDDVMNSLSGHLADAKLMILPNVRQRIVTERTTKSGAIMFNVACEVAYDFVAEDGSRHTVITWGEAQDSGDKATNKAMSAALKYACLQVFMIPTEGDNDADANTPEPTVKGLPEGAVADHLSDINSSGSMEELEKSFRNAYGAAKAANDKTAAERFTAAKEAIKTLLKNGEITN